jgi:hypothetical protein
MPTNGQLGLCEDEKDVDQKVYCSMIRSFLYLCASRPYISLSVGLCARYKASPKESHLMAVKRILRYLAHTPFLGLWYPKGATFSLVGYSDSDWAGDKVDQKSTSGTCQFLLKIFGELEVKEAKLHIYVHHQSRVCCRVKLLCPITLDEANLEGLWNYATLMW